jgi:hypothetical protein
MRTKLSCLGGAEEQTEQTKAGAMLAYLFTDCDLDAGVHFVFSSISVRKDGNSNALGS